MRRQFALRAAHADRHGIKAGEALCHVAAEVARSENEHGLAEQCALRAGRLPDGVLLLLAVGREVAVHREDTGKDVFGNRPAERARGIREHHVFRKSRAARIDVGPGPCHLYPAQAFRPLDQLHARLTDADLRVPERFRRAVERQVARFPKAAAQHFFRFLAALCRDDDPLFHRCTSQSNARRAPFLTCTTPHFWKPYFRIAACMDWLFSCVSMRR